MLGLPNNKSERENMKVDVISSLADRLKFALQSTPGATQAGLARACGISPAAVSGWFSGKTKSISASNLIGAANYFKIEPDWLVRGEPMITTWHLMGRREKMEAGDIAVAELAASYEDGYEDFGKFGSPPESKHLIPRYDTGGRMGETGLVLTGYAGAIENLKVDEEWLRKNLKGYTSTKNLYVITGFGESMEPLFKAGDPLIIDNSVTEFVGDFPYFFRIGNEGYIKKLQQVPGGYMALSVNKDYLPFQITPDMDFAILAKIVKAWGSTDF